MSGALTLSADTVGETFTMDPELSLPVYPRYINETVCIPYGSAGLLFEGVQGTQVLKGRSTRTFIPRLLEKLDGTLTISQICEYFPHFPKSVITNAVALLYSRGLLEDGNSILPNEVDRAADAFFGRYIDVTRVNKNRKEVADRLASCSVAIVSSESNADSVLASFAGLGLKSVTRIESTDDINTHLDLVVMFFTPEVTERESARWLEVAWENRVKTLHARVDSGGCELGPLFIPGKSACYRCFRKIRPYANMQGNVNPGVWAAVSALQAIQLLTRVGRTHLYNRCHSHQSGIDGASYEEVAITRMPGCQSCGLDGVVASTETQLIWQLHCATNAMPPHDLLCPRDYQIHYAPTNVLISKEQVEPYYGAQELPLPNSSELNCVPSWVSAKGVSRVLDISVVSDLLRYSVGYQHDANGNQRRIAPSAGGLGSSEAFLIVRDVGGLPRGVYHYHAAGHQLYRLGSYSEELLMGALGARACELPQLLLINVGSMTKLRQKYGDFAYRFANLDSGFSLVYQLEMLSSFHLKFGLYNDVRNSVLTNMLSVPTAGNRNLITSVMGIGDLPPKTGQDPRHMLRCMDELASLSAAGFGSDARKYDELAEVERCARHDGDFASSRGISDLFLSRRSVRRFANTYVALDKAAVLADLAAQESGYIERKGGLALDMHINLALKSEEGYRLYRWASLQGDWQCLSNRVTPGEINQALIQRALASAPAIFFLTGNFHLAVERYGARGHQALMQRSGSLAAKLLIVASSLGISGCPWGGLCEDAWGDILSIDRYQDCPLFGVSLGYADE